MNTSAMNTYQRGPIGVGSSMIPDRLVSIAATVYGIVLLAFLTVTASAMLREDTQQDRDSFSPATAAFDDQFHPLEIDLYTKPLRSTQS